MNVQELIDAINQEWEEKLDKIRAEIVDLVHENPVLDYFYGYNVALMKAAQIIDKCKAESKGVLEQTEWIPVDYDRYPETYPKAFQEVWITDGYGEVYHKAYDGTRSIKAWMPYIIPKPYKAESEG